MLYALFLFKKTKNIINMSFANQDFQRRITLKTVHLRYCGKIFASARPRDKPVATSLT